jgi:hypothetical protein
MEFQIEYVKNKGEVFQTLDNYNLVFNNQIQNYMPLYDIFFKLNDTNYNHINLNTNWLLESFEKRVSHNVFICKMKNTKNDHVENKKVFIKFSPLLDPTKYITGKYELTSNLFDLPKLNNENVHKKIRNKYNSAYVDSFFSYLSSKLLKHHDVFNCLEYYGSFLCNQKDYKVNIFDDVDYLVESPFFHKNKDKLFKIDDSFYEELDDNDSRSKKKKIIIDTNIDLEVNDIDNNMYDDIFVKPTNELTVFNLKQLEDTNLNEENIGEIDNINTSKIRSNSVSESSCSSRTSNTNSNSDSESICSSDLSDIDTDELSDEEEEEIFAYIDNFPVNMICLESCSNTLDDYMINNDIENKEWAGIFMQIIFTLLIYQKCFSFTHNDLHTNNVMYVETDKQNLIYHYDNNYYKIPTFGKIWKIIDFGRAIYKFKGQIIGSDSFAPNEDAATQYNCEPFYDSNKPKLEPNFSFDLCRFGCSLYDFFIEDDEEEEKMKHDYLDKLIMEWCTDDNNKNILYKKNGEERYPDFKLYKMIARNVHNHTPENQLKRNIFSSFVTSRKKLSKNSKILFIDKLPCYC